MKKIFLSLLIISSIYGNEQSNDKESFDINKDWIYNGCRDVLANKWTENRNYIFGLAVAKKDATIDLMDLMAMRTVNGVDESNVCKWFLDFSNGNDSAKYINSAQDSKRVFLAIVERSVILDNGETIERFSENLETIRKLFKK